MNVIDRRHPEYNNYIDIWNFFLEAYKGGEHFVKKHLFKYYKEGDEEYKERQARAYRENYVKKIVNIFNSYLFQEQAIRETKNNLLNEWLQNITGKDETINDFMRLVSLMSYVLGRVYVVVDKQTLPEEQKTGTRIDTLKAKPYVYLLYPQDILDISFDENENIRWVLVEERKRDDEDPFTSSGDVLKQYRLWTTTEWLLFDENGEQIDSGVHNLGVVPIIPVNNEKTDDLYYSQGLVDDVAYIDRAIFNNWSRLDTIINDQTFSQLIIPVEGVILTENDEDLKEQFLTMSTKRAFLYSAQASQPPQFISPDASQAELILNTIKTQITQLYASLGLQSETGVEIKAQSGVAKAYDFDKINKILSNKADNLERVEKSIIKLWRLWNGLNDVDYVVDYPDSFDVKSLADELSLAQELSMLDISKTFDNEIKKLIVQKALPKLSSEIYEQIVKEIEEKSQEPQNGESIFPFDTKTPSN